MKKPDAFDRKRKVRDERNKRFLKSRNIIPWAILMFVLMGAAVCGTIFLALSTPYDAFMGALCGAVIGAGISPFYIVRELNK